MYQDTFEEGNFYGKGLIHVDQYLKIGRTVFPENRILSHDLLEGCYIRTALISDVELFEEFPENYLTEAFRRHRWVRGDWQIASWLFGTVPTSNGGYVRNPLCIVSKWKIFDNLRRTMIPLSMFILLVNGWIMFPLNSTIPLLLTFTVLSVDLFHFSLI